MGEYWCQLEACYPGNHCFYRKFPNLPALPRLSLTNPCRHSRVSGEGVNLTIFTKGQNNEY